MEVSAKYEDVLLALLEDTRYSSGTVQFPSELAAKVTRIGRGAMRYSRFSGKVEFSNLTSCSDAGALDNIEMGYFYGTKFTRISAPKLSTLGGSMCDMCFSLTGAYFPEARSYSNRAQFYHCNALLSTGIDLNKFSGLPANFYNQCLSLTGVLSSNVLTRIGKGCFSWCGAIVDVRFPNLIGSGIDSVGQSTEEFSNMKALSSIYIPNYRILSGQGGSYVNSWILKQADSLVSADFSNATYFGKVIERAAKLKIIDFRNRTLSSVPIVRTDSFPSTPNYKFVVPDELYETWISSGNWPTYASKIVKASEYLG